MRKTFLPAALSLLLGILGAPAQDSRPDAAAAAPVKQLDEIVVSANPLRRSAFDLAEPVSILSGEKLRLKVAPTLGETLSTEPGVTSSYFTPGASRPIIRGLADNRVLILNNGTDIFDVSNLSPDHNPSVSPLLAQSIEVVRGPATILYGSSAIGGVVNVRDGRIPEAVPTPWATGNIAGRFESANLEHSTAGAFDLRLSKNLVLHLDGMISAADSVRVPGYALSNSLRDHLSPAQKARGNQFGGDPHGYVPNTQIYTADYGIGLSYVGDRGFIGVSYNYYRSIYGVPDDPAVDDPDEAPEPVKIDMEKRQYSLRAGFKDPLPFFADSNFKFTWTDYQHLELDGNSVGATFKTDGLDSRVELIHEPIGNLSGSIGGQAIYRTLSILGGEAFLQPTQTLAFSGFAFEEYKWDQLTFQLGGRLELNNVRIDSDDPELTSLTSSSQQNQTFLPISAAAGVIWDFAKDTNAALTVRYSERAPTAEELYARGPHDATFQFLVGDPGLSVERVLGLDLSVRKRSGIVTGSLSGFYNHFFNFIDFANTGEVEDDLPVYDYTGKTAVFFGGEGKVAVHFLPQEITVPGDQAEDKSAKAYVKGAADSTAPNPHDLYLEFRGDYTFAEDLTNNDPLPRIPPFRWGASLVYQGPAFGASLDFLHVNNQNRVAEFEDTTPGYTFLNASVSYTVPIGETSLNVYVKGTNLLNQTARDNSSFLKDVLPLAGRGILVGAQFAF